MLYRIWLAFGWLGVALIAYLSLMQFPPQPVHFEYADKVEHAMSYGFVMLWFCQLYKHGKGLVVGLLLLALGIGLEYLQGITGYRSFEYADMLADGTGILLAWSLAHTAMGRVYYRFESLLNKF